MIGACRLDLFIAPTISQLILFQASNFKIYRLVYLRWCTSTFNTAATATVSIQVMNMVLLIINSIKSEIYALKHSLNFVPMLPLRPSWRKSATIGICYRFLNHCVNDSSSFSNGNSLGDVAHLPEVIPSDARAK